MARGISSFSTALIAVVIVVYLSTTWNQQRIHEHPANSVFSILTFVSLLVPLSRRAFDRHVSRAARYLPVSDPENSDQEDKVDADISSSGHYAAVSPLGPRLRRHLFLVILFSFILRIALLLHIEANSECSCPGVEAALLPILLFMYDFMVLQKSWTVAKEDDNEMSNSAFDDLYSSLCYSRSRYLLPTVLFVIGVILTISRSLHSTYVCSSAGQAIHIFPAQILATILDAVLILAIYRISNDTSNGQQQASIISSIALLTAAFMAVVSGLYLVRVGQFSKLIILDSTYLWSLVKIGVSCSGLVLCLEHLVQVLRPLTTTILFLFFGIFPHLVLEARISRDMFPLRPKTTKMLGLSCLYVGFILGMSFYKNTEIKGNFARRIPQWFYAVIGVGFVVSQVFYITGPRYVGFSPINYLMYEAKISAKRWLMQASASTTLSEAVQQYQWRYHQAPPPNFDKWFAFAIERNAYIIDDYDEMQNSLLPFWALFPSDIRSRTLMQDGAGDVIGLTIRHSEIKIGHVPSSEALWIQGAADLIGTFSKWLPDMDITFNVGPNPRLAVPWKEMEKLRRAASGHSRKTPAVEDKFSQTVDPPWSGFDAHFDTGHYGKSQDVPEYSKISVFDDLYAPTCKPGSEARDGRFWNAGSFCAACARPHAIGPYIQNWTLAGDFCHQPDMAAQHMYLSSYVAPETAHRTLLRPLFSRHKMQGFSDILFPGPGTFIDNTQYPVPSDTIPSELVTYNDTVLFSAKRDTLYWRGELDGTITDSTWKGGQAQRLVRLINNSTNPVALLLPNPKRLTYKNVPAEKVRNLINADVSFSHPTVCEENSACYAQVQEFGTTAPVSAETWFQNRYLLSIDMPPTYTTAEDPIAPPTFLQILASNSVPVYSTIYQSWYSHFVTPWLHYIPIDLRYQGLHASLAYFTGLKSKKGSDDGTGDREVVLEGKYDQASYMATTGREWAGRVLRREDAEVYAFRLLLEYARLVDDRRDELGFRMPEGES